MTPDPKNSDSFTKPTSLSSPGAPRRTSSGMAAAKPKTPGLHHDPTPSPAVLAVGDKSGTVEVDPDRDGVELDDDLDFDDLAAPPAATPAPSAARRGAVVKSLKDKRPEKPGEPEAHADDEPRDRRRQRCPRGRRDRRAPVGPCGRSRTRAEHPTRAGRRAQAGRHRRPQRRADAVGTDRCRPAARAEPRRASACDASGTAGAAAARAATTARSARGRVADGGCDAPPVRLRNKTDSHRRRPRSSRRSCRPRSAARSCRPHRRPRTRRSRSARR